MFCLSESTRLREIESDGSYWIFDIQDGSHYEVNETAYIILCGVQVGQSSAQIVAEMIGEFEVSNDVATKDVTETLMKFEQLGLIQKEEIA